MHMGTASGSPAVLIMSAFKSCGVNPGMFTPFAHALLTQQSSMRQCNLLLGPPLQYLHLNATGLAAPAAAGLMARLSLYMPKLSQKLLHRLLPMLSKRPTSSVTADLAARLRAYSRLRSVLALHC